MIPHDIRIDLIPFAVQECHIQHVKKPPVLRYCIAMGITLQERCNSVFLFLCIGIPDFFFAAPETYNKGTGLNGLLIGPVGIVLSTQTDQFVIGSYVIRIFFCTGSQYLRFIVITQMKA